MGDAKLIARVRRLLADADPGPWAVCPMEEYVMLGKDGDQGMVFDRVHDYDDAPPDTVARVSGHGRRAPQEANLRLIAAAPELLAALADALESAEAGNG